MSVLTLGINHKTAPISIRERLAFTSDHVSRALCHLRDSLSVTEAALLSTCNRTEFYCTGVSEDRLVQWWQQYHSLDPEDVRPYLYSHHGQSAVAHMMRVASGLDSLVVGEPEIFGQMKKAYTLAGNLGVLGKPLSRLFQDAFSAAKQVRSETLVGAQPVSVAFAAVNLAKHIFADIKRARVLLVGAGQTIELAAEHLHKQGVADIIVLNRTLENAQTLAARFGATAAPLPALSTYLPQVDIVISSTGSREPQIGRTQVLEALKLRKRRPIFMVDLAVPRDIEGGVSTLEDVYLYTIDDLQGIVENNRQHRLGAAEQAEVIIKSQANAYMNWLKAQNTIGLVSQYREKISTQTQMVLKQAQESLKLGKDPSEALDALAHDLSNKWMHGPTLKLRQAAFEGDEQTIEAFRRLFDTDG